MSVFTDALKPPTHRYMHTTPVVSRSANILSIFNKAEKSPVLINICKTRKSKSPPHKIKFTKTLLKCPYLIPK